MPRGKYERNFGDGVCEFCQTTFPRRMPKQRFCSDACRLGGISAQSVINQTRVFLDDLEASLRAKK